MSAYQRDVAAPLALEDGVTLQRLQHWHALQQVHRCAASIAHELRGLRVSHQPLPSVRPDGMGNTELGYVFVRIWAVDGYGECEAIELSSGAPAVNDAVTHHPF